MTAIQYGPTDGTTPTQLHPPQSIERTYTGAPEPTGDRLADTGADIVNLAAIGVVVLLLGLVLLRLRQARAGWPN